VSRCLLCSSLQALRAAGVARAAGRTAAAGGAASSQLFSLSDDGVMSLASLGGAGDSLAATALEASQLQGEISVLCGAYNSLPLI
jgi:hypothetical protein